MATNNDIEKRLWAAADQLWANSNLKPSEFSTPVLGLIFLRYADHKFTQVEAALAKRNTSGAGAKFLIFQAMAPALLISWTWETVPYFPSFPDFPRFSTVEHKGSTTTIPLNRVREAYER